MIRRVKKKSNPNINLRFNLLSVFVYLIGIVLIIQLFNLQIVNGAKYREQSNTRLTRETVQEVARGNILDRAGNILVGSNMKFGLELYKTKIDSETLNNSIFNIIRVLEKFSVSYPNSFPISIDPFKFDYEGKKLKKWLKDENMDENMTAEEVFFKFKDRYKINRASIEETRKILGVRYEISKKGYSNTRAIKIAKNIPREAVAIFSENGDMFPGINITVEPERVYPKGSLASHILGYVSKIGEKEYNQKKDRYDQNDMIGKTGIEYVFEEFLKGKKGIKQIDMAVDGTITGEYIAKEAIAGSDIVLTIDANLQKVTEDAIKANMEKIRRGGFGKVYDAISESCIVMDVKTGQILAMASYPDYNPSDFVGGISTENWNKYMNDRGKPLVNKNIQTSYSPGSIFKMITAIAGLESGAITPSTKINDTGYYRKYEKYGTVMSCWLHSGHGWLDVVGAIEKSCNYFFYETADRMQIDTLNKYSRYFGLGEKTGVELQDETAGVLASKETKKKLHPNEATWGPGDTLNAAIGQGDNEFSPLQMAKYISMIANGGKPIDVSVIKTIRNSNGIEESRQNINKFINAKLGIEEKEIEDVSINEKNMKVVLEGMKSVTEEGGTASSIFRNFQIPVGGKTGSAEAPGNKVNAWFAGFAPFDNPEIAVVVMAENGGHGYYTAEAVREIMQEYFGMNVNNVSEDVTEIPYVEIFR